MLVSLCAAILCGPIAKSPRSGSEFIRTVRSALTSSPRGISSWIIPESAWFLRAVGKPDRVESGVGKQAWVYEFTANDSLATSATIQFTKLNVGGQDSTWVFDSWELSRDEKAPFSDLTRAKVKAHVSLLRQRRPEPETICDPLNLMIATNRLSTLGRRGALDVLCAFAREHYPDRPEKFPFYRDERWAFWLLLTLFKPAKPNAFLERPGFGVTKIEFEASESWPTAPILFGGDVPFNLFQGDTVRGVRQAAYRYLLENEVDWELRSEPLEPPDDPFLACKAAMNSPQYLRLKQRSSPSAWRAYDERVLQQALLMVQSVYRPEKPWKDPFLPVDMKDFERYHAEFLARRAYWDRVKQDYVSRQQ